MPNKVLLVLGDRNPNHWKHNLLQSDSSLSIDIWPNISQTDDYVTAVIWKQPNDLSNNFKKLRLICSIGAGVDHILGDTYLPPGIKITRIVDTSLTKSMTKFVLMSILNFERQFIQLYEARQNHIWEKPIPFRYKPSVGILGLGVLGKDLATQLNLLDYEVHGLANTEKNIPGVYTYRKNQLDIMLGKINILVNLLPLTSETKGILNYSLFNKCKPGTYLIHVARGKHLVEDDLLKALNSENLSGALIDVFDNEPLPQNHAFWKDSRIMITPHIASITNPAEAAAQIVENHQRILMGKPLLNEVDRAKGY